MKIRQTLIQRKSSGTGTGSGFVGNHLVIAHGLIRNMNGRPRPRAAPRIGAQLATREALITGILSSSDARRFLVLVSFFGAPVQTLAKTQNLAGGCPDSVLKSLVMGQLQARAGLAMKGYRRSEALFKLKMNARIRAQFAWFRKVTRRLAYGVRQFCPFHSAPGTAEGRICQLPSLNTTSSSSSTRLVTANVSTW